jgi:Tfp pilus assembly PilM family ATPase
MRAGNFTYMMAVGCVREDVERTLDNFESAGLTPVAMDARAWAMARAVRPLASAQAHVSAVLDMSDSEAILSVVHSNVVVYERLMADAGVSGLAGKLRTQLQLEPDVADYVLESVGVSGGPEHEHEGRLSEASAMIREYFGPLMQEFRTALAYATHRYPGEVETVFVHGAGAAIPGLVRVMSDDLGVKIVVPAPADLSNCPESLKAVCGNPSLTTALGLAIHPGVAA